MLHTLVETATMLAPPLRRRLRVTGLPPPPPPPGDDPLGLGSPMADSASQTGDSAPPPGSAGDASQEAQGSRGEAAAANQVRISWKHCLLTFAVVSGN